MCASKAPMPTTTPVDKPNLSAHSELKFPAGSSDLYVSVNSLDVKPFNNGSSDEKNSSGGSPPNSSAQRALCPAEQRPRFSCAASVPPVNKNGIQSQCSTHECVAAATAASERRVRSSFAQNHSDE